MQSNGIEKQVLEELSKQLVMKKDELAAFLKDKVDNPHMVVTTITKALNDKGFITYVSPIGESCYAITQRGMREILKC